MIALSAYQRQFTAFPRKDCMDDSSPIRNRVSMWCLPETSCQSCNAFQSQSLLSSANKAVNAVPGLAVTTLLAINKRSLPPTFPIINTIPSTQGAFWWTPGGSSNCTTPQKLVRAIIASMSASRVTTMRCNADCLRP